MAADPTTARERLPRRGRYLIPSATPRRAELVAVCATATIIAHLLFAQLTIVLAVVFHGVTRTSRWRPLWLLAPALAGLAWALAIGPGNAVDGMLAGPRQVAAYLAGIGGDPARVAHLSVAMRGIGGWLPRQFPLALITGAAEAALAAWVSWLHTDEWRLLPSRPGLVAAVRRLLTTRAVRAGGVVTADGCCLGVAVRSGAGAALSWAEAADGVLCTGSPRSGTTTTSLQLVHAAIRRRKPVIAIDLAGDQAVAARLAGICAATDTPFAVFGPVGPDCYEPVRGGGPGARSALLMGMINWDGIADQYRRSCGSYLGDLFSVLDAAPGDPRTPVLDEVLHLLDPGELRARAGHIPPYHPRRDALTERVKVSASLQENDPQTLAGLSGQLGELRVSAIGRWLRPAAAGSRIDLDQVLRERSVTLFSLPAALGPPAGMVASLVAQDLLAACAELRRIGVDGDGLTWFDQCGSVPVGVLTGLVRDGSAAGMATVLTTTDAQPADRLAESAGTVLMHRMTDPVTAERFAWLTGEKLVPGEVPGAGAPPGGGGDGRGGPLVSTSPGGARHISRSPGVRAPGTATTFVRHPVVSPEVLCTLADGEFVLTVKAPRQRLLPLGRVIPARMPAQPHATAAPGPWIQPGEPLEGPSRRPRLAGAFTDPEQRR